MGDIANNKTPADAVVASSGDSTGHAAESPAPPVTKSQSSLWRRVLSLVWDTADGDVEYRKYVQRLDLFVL